ncbi:MAG TPA: CcdB family protein [Aliidongia sp.]|uniref:CcdB family protein n=1 Tax=Aliidongia sp. TaxID=1914230 RepID=UPI002DDD3186|nr:CcdB family protein [Aliidongia sp.]HEV2673117.1 CcdB family protein [Aliidongia sp.]
MAQFDVHRNIGPQKRDLPFVVVVQSRRFDSSGRRVVVPLTPAAGISFAEGRLNPTFEVEDRLVVLHPLLIVSIALDQLGPKVGSLATEGNRIIAALDLVVSRAWD